MKTKSKKIGYEWVIVILCCFMVMMALGFGSSTKSLFPDEISKALGVERSLVSLGESARYIATAIVNVFFGMLVAKFGAKKLICAGFISLISSMLLYAYAENIPTIIVAGALLGIGFSWTTTTMVGYIVNIWHPERRGTIMGIVLASNGVGGAIAIELAGSLIDPTVTGSYRTAYKMIAAVLAATLIVLVIFLREKKPEGDRASTAKRRSRGRNWEGLDFSVLVRKPYFWLALVCIFFCGFILQGTYGIVAMHCKDVGIDYSAVRALLSFGSLLLSLAKFLSGFIYDKLGLRFSVNMCTVVAVASAVILMFVDGSPRGFVLAVLYSVVSQFALPLETVIIPIYASDLCGRRAYNKALGIFVSVNTAGYAVSAPVMNLCYDVLGSYVPALAVSVAIMIGVFIILQFVITAAHKEQKKLEAGKV